MQLKDLAKLYKDSQKIAIYYKNKGYSYKQLYSDAMELFPDKYIYTGNAAILLPNSYEFVYSLMGVFMSNHTAVPLAVSSTSSELSKELELCDISVVITNSIYVESLLRAIEKLAIKIDIYMVDKKEWLYSTCQPINNYDYVNEDIALLMHTSGSLSSPKRVMLSSKNILANANSIIESLNLSNNEITIIALPLYLISAMTSQLITHLLINATIVIMEPPFLLNDFCQLVDKYSVTNFTCVPTILYIMTMRDITFLNRLPSLRKICFGGAPTPKSLISKLININSSIEFIQMYGQTEASARLTHLLPEDFNGNIGSVGKPIPGVSIIILDKNNHKCNPYDVGEICAAGDNIMMGYYKDCNKTNETIISNYLHTGDLGYYNSEGFLFIIGRKKNVIISGGINIYPEEIEEVLMSFDFIEGAMVYGEADDLMGEIVCAKVILLDTQISVDKIKKLLSMQLSLNKIPKKIQVVNSLDKTSNGKLRRVYND